MKLMDRLNAIKFVGEMPLPLTFVLSEPGQDDVDPDDCREQVASFLIDEMAPGVEADHARQLCIYGAALFAAIDAHQVGMDYEGPQTTAAPDLMVAASFMATPEHRRARRRLGGGGETP